MDIEITMVSDDEAMLACVAGPFESSAVLTLAEVGHLARWVPDDYPLGLDTALGMRVRVMACCAAQLERGIPTQGNDPGRALFLRFGDLARETYVAIGRRAAAVLTAQREDTRSRLIAGNTGEVIWWMK